MCVVEIEGVGHERADGIDEEFCAIFVAQISDGFDGLQFAGTRLVVDHGDPVVGVILEDIFDGVEVEGGAPFLRMEGGVGIVNFGNIAEPSSELASGEGQDVVLGLYGGGENGLVGGGSRTGEDDDGVVFIGESHEGQAGLLDVAQERRKLAFPVSDFACDHRVKYALGDVDGTRTHQSITFSIIFHSKISPGSSKNEDVRQMD